MSFSASCDCGQLQFETQVEPVVQLVCHCQDCRQALQADFAEIVFFNLVSSRSTGESEANDFVALSGSTTTREFCHQCKTVMFDKSAGFPQLIGVMAAQMQAPFEFRPRCHVFVESKADHTEIDSAIRQYPQGIGS